MVSQRAPGFAQGTQIASRALRSSASFALPLGIINNLTTNEYANSYIDYSACTKDIERSLQIARPGKHQVIQSQDPMDGSKMEY